MNKELIMALDALEKENGIDKEIMFAAIEKSLMDEYKAEFDKADNGRVELDRRTGDFHIYSDRTVVEEVIVPENRENKKEKYVSGTDIALEDARKTKPDCQLGDVITVEVKSEEFSRKAAKNAKNTIVQTIREQENTLAKLEAKTWGVTFVNGENGKFLVLPSGVKGENNWTVEKKNAVRLVRE